MKKVVTILLVSVIGIMGCSDDLTLEQRKMLKAGVDIHSPGQVAKWKDEEEKRFMLWQEKRDENERKKKLNLSDASDQELSGLLSECKSVVIKEVQSQFGKHIIDQYSANVHISIAGSKAVESDEERIEDFRGYGVLNGKYAVITAFDSFDGVKRVIHNYSCKFEGQAVTWASRTNTTRLN